MLKNLFRKAREKLASLHEDTDARVATDREKAYEAARAKAAKKQIENATNSVRSARQSLEQQIGLAPT